MQEQLSLCVPGTALAKKPVDEPVASDDSSHRRQLRPYQERISTEAKQLLETDYSCLVPMATGTGKTVTAHEVIRWAVHERSFRVLWLVHREELVNQAFETFKDIAPTQIEMQSSKADAGARIVIASKDSLQFRLRRYPKDHFGLVVTDEVHHGTARSYRKIYEYFSAGTVHCWHLGLSATPDRTDGVALGSDVGGILRRSVAPYLYDTAVADGYLVPFKPKRIKLDSVDLSNVRTIAGDLNQSQLAQIMEAEKPLHGAAAALLTECDKRPTIVFASSVSHATRIAEILNRYRPGCANVVTGETEKGVRRGLFRTFGKDYQFLCNYGVATEGVDLPIASAIAILRPTKSRLLYTQMAGRGTRPTASLYSETQSGRRLQISESNKPNCLLLDFVGVAGKHSLIGPLDLLGGKPSNPHVQAIANELMEAGNVTLEQAVAIALKRTEEEKEEAKRRAEEREQERIAKLARIRGDASYGVSEIDPGSLIRSNPEASLALGPNLATAQQIEQATHWGLVLPPGCSAKKANGILWNERTRRRRGLATAKQVNMLQKHWNKHFPDRLMSAWEVLRLTNPQAKELCQELSNKWGPRKT